MEFIIKEQKQGEFHSLLKQYSNIGNNFGMNLITFSHSDEYVSLVCVEVPDAVTKKLTEEQFKSLKNLEHSA